MKRSLSLLVFACGLAAAMIVLALSSPAAAQTTYTWDGSQSGSLADSGGAWDYTNYDWSTTAGSADVQWQDNNNAVFGSAAPGNGAYAVTLGGNVAPTGIELNNPGYTINRDASNLYSLTVGSNGITANASATINAPVILGVAQAWTTAAGQQLAVNGNISGGVGLTVYGNGALTLAGTNSYIGGTTVAGGALIAATPAALPSYASISVSSGAALGLRVGLPSGDFQPSDIASVLGAATFQAGSSLGFDTTDGNYTYAGNFTSGVGVAKFGNNLLALTGSINFTGPTTLTASGNTYVNNAANLSGGTVQFSGVDTFSGNITGGATGLTYSGTLAHSGGSGVSTYTSGTTTYTTIGNPGVTLIVSGGTTTLAGHNSYAGFTWIGSNWCIVTPTIVENGGVLSFSSAASLPPLPNNTWQSNSIQVNNGTLLYTGTGTTDSTFLDMALTNATIDIQNAGANFTYRFGLNGCSFTKTGLGAFTLAGGNNGSGAAVQQGTLVLNSPGYTNQSLSGVSGVSLGATLQMGSAAGPGQIYGGINNMNGTLDLNAMTLGLYYLDGSGTVANSNNSATGNLFFGWNPDVWGNGYDTFAGAIADGAGPVSLTVTRSDYYDGANWHLSNAPLLVLTGTRNAYSGGTTINSGTLQIGDGTTSPGSLPGNVVIGTMTISDTSGYAGTYSGALVFNTPLGMSVAASGNISGSGTGGLTKNGPGLLTLSGVNSYAGTTTVNGGLLAFNGATAVPAGTDNILINAGGAVTGGYGTLGAWMNSNQIVPSSAGILAVLTGYDASTIDMTNYPNLAIGTVGGATFAGTIVPAGGGYKIGGGGGVLTFATALTGGNSLSVFAGGAAGTLILTGANAYSGGTTIGGGLLVFSSAAALPPGAGGIAVNSGGALAATGAYNSINGWMNSGQIAASSAGVLALSGSDAETVNMASLPNLFLGTAGAATFSGNLMPANASYRLGGGGGVLAVSSNLGGNNSLNAFGGGSGGTLILSGNVTYTGNTNITSGGTLQFSSAANQFVSGNISGGGALATTGPGALILAGNNSYTGATTIGGGTLEFSNAAGETLNGNITNGGALVMAGAGALTLNGAISGGGALVMAGPGTLTLAGNNSCTGPTTVDGGVLALSGVAAVPPGSGNITINPGGAVSGGYGTIGGWIASGKIVASSAGVLALTGSDAETVSMASLPNLYVGSAGAATFSGSLTPAGAAYQLGGGGGALTVSSNLGGSKGLNAFGGGSGGTLILSGNNTYNGGTTINGGVVAFSSAAAIPAGTGNIAVNYGGALAVSGAYNTIGGWIGSNKIAAGSAGVLALTGGNDAESVSMASLPNVYIGASGAATFSGSLTPAGAAYQLGGGGGALTVPTNLGGGYGLAVGGGAAGTLILTGGGNSYSGGTTIDNGVLQIGDGATNAGSLPGNVVINSATPGALTYNLPPNASINPFNAGVVSGSGGGGLTVSSGSLFLYGTSNYAGPVTMTGAGFIEMDSVTAISPSSAVTDNGSSLYTNSAVNGGGGWTTRGGLVFGPGVTNVAFGSLSGSGSLLLATIYGEGVALTVGGNGASTTFTGELEDRWGSPLGVTKTGAGAWTLGGGYDNDSLGIYVTQGTLVLAHVGGHAVSGVGGVSPGATLQLGAEGNAVAQVYGGVGNMNGTFDFNGFNEGVVGLNGTGTVTNSAPNTVSTLTFGYTVGGRGAAGDTSNYSDAFAGNIVDGNGAMALSLTTDSTGALAFTLTGTGNAYSGGTSIYEGMLKIGDGSTSPGSLPGNVVVSSTTAGALTFNTPAGMSVAASGNISGNGSGGLTKTGSGILILSGSNSYSGGTTVSQGVLTLSNKSAQPSSGTINVAASATLGLGVGGAGGFNAAAVDALFAGTMPGVSMNASSNVGIDTTAGNFTYSSNIPSTAMGLTKLGANTLILTGSNAYSGATTVTAGALEAATTASLPGYGTANKVSVAGGAMLIVQPGGSSGWGNAQVGNLLGAVNWAGNAAFGVDTTNGNYTYGGNITQALALTKLGANVLTLTGANTYPGPTVVDGGTLQIGNGGSGEGLTSNITMNNNAAVAFNHADPLSYSGVISGSGQLIKLGTGNLDLVGSGTYSGPTTISAGTLELDGGGNNLPAATALTIASSGVLDLAGNPLTVGSLSGSAGAIVANSLSPEWPATLTVAPSAGATTTFAGNIIGSNALALSGSGQLTLSGTNTYTGGTTVSGGTLDIAAPSALAGSGLVTIAAGGRLVLGSGAGIGALLAASSPAGSDAVALSGAASASATLGGSENTAENMATLGGAPPLSQGGGGSAVGGAAAAVPEPGTFALLGAGALGLIAWARRRRKAT